MTFGIRNALVLVAALATLSSAACLQGERFNPRVIEIDSSNGDDIDFDYGEDGLLSEIEFGPVDISLSWSNGNITAYEQGDALTTVAWESGRVTRLFRADETGTFETLYTYAGSALIHVERIQSRDGERVYATEITLRYHPEGPLDAVTHAYDSDGDGVLESFAETHTYRYDADGRIERVVHSNTQGVQNDILMGYTDGVLARMDRWDVDYDTQGRIGTLTHNNNRRYDIYYESGGSAQVVVEPMVLPFAPFVDWSGQTFSAPDPRSLSLVLDLARPFSL